jgi:hypothetical protein
MNFTILGNLQTDGIKEIKKRIILFVFCSKHAFTVLDESNADFKAIQAREKDSMNINTCIYMYIREISQMLTYT